MCYKMTHVPPKSRSYRHILEGNRNGRAQLEDRLRIATEQIRKKVDPDGKITRRGQNILDTIARLSRAGTFKLPRIIICEETLERLEQCEKPQEIISLEEIEHFLAVLGSGRPQDAFKFLEDHGLRVVTAFPVPKEESGKLMLLSGPSGVGKGTIQEKFLVPQGLPKWIFHNIRDRRAGERNGGMYYYVQSDQDMPTRCRTLVEMHEKGVFVASAVVHQPEIAHIPNKRSQGVGKNLFELIQNGEDWFAEVDLKLAAQLIMRARSHGIKVNYVFLLPSRFEDLMGRIIRRTLIKNGGDPDKITEKEIQNMRNRMLNAQGEISFSILLHPKYVINTENQEEAAGRSTMIALGFEPRKSPLVAEQIGKKVSGGVTINEYDDAIQSAKAEGLELLPENYPAILSVPGEINSSLRAGIDHLLKKEGRLSVPSLLDFMGNEISSLVWEARGNPVELAKQIHPGEHLKLRQKYTLAMQVGVLAPYHHADISFAQAAILDGGLAGVVALLGGDPPEKPFVVASHHREAMVRLGLIGRSYLHYSPIRIEMAKILKGIDMGGRNEKENCRLRDLAAFSFLIAMNRHVKWEYLTTADTVNQYGISGTNERDLVLNLLMGSGIPVRYYPQGNSRFDLFDREEAYVRSHRGIESWVLENREQLEQYLLQGTIPSAPITFTQIRKMVEGYVSLLDLMPEEVIGYIYDQDLRQAYILENKAKWLQKQLSSDSITTAQAQRFLDALNEERIALYERGILAHEEPLTLNDIRNLA